MNEQPTTAAGAATVQRYRVRTKPCLRNIRTLVPPLATRAVRANARRCAGASLLEALVAVSLLAVSLLGLAAAQLAALRDGGAQARREQASWMAASIAETMRMPAWAAPMLARSRASIETELPGARLSFGDEAAGIGTIIVHWGRAQDAQQGAQRPEAGPCGLTPESGRVHCIVQPFAAGGA
jgi:hypothetical protein